MATELRLFERLFHRRPTRCRRARSAARAAQPHEPPCAAGGWVEPALADRRARAATGSSSATATSWPTAWTTRAGQAVFNRITGLKDTPTRSKEAYQPSQRRVELARRHLAAPVLAALAGNNAADALSVDPGSAHGRDRCHAQHPCIIDSRPSLLRPAACWRPCQPPPAAWTVKLHRAHQVCRHWALQQWTSEQALATLQAGSFESLGKPAAGQGHKLSGGSHRHRSGRRARSGRARNPDLRVLRGRADWPRISAALFVERRQRRTLRQGDRAGRWTWAICKRQPVAGPAPQPLSPMNATHDRALVHRRPSSLLNDSAWVTDL